MFSSQDNALSHSFIFYGKVSSISVCDDPGSEDLAAAELWVVCKATPVVTQHLSLTG